MAFAYGRRALRALLTACASLGVGVDVARAQGDTTFPSRTVRILASEAGGSVDLVARTLALRLGEQWGQPVVVENRGGAGGIIYTEAAARSPADGHTLVVGHTGTLAINPSLYKSLPYDVARDFVPVAPVLGTPLIIVTHPDLPARTLPDLIGLARTKANEVTYASAGSGTASHLAASWLADLARVAFLHVPFRGSGPATAAVVSGNVAMMFAPQASTAALVRAGKLRVLGITSARRSAEAPDLPTVAEQGLAGFEVINWQGVLVPSGVPRELVARLNADVRKALAHEDSRRRLSTFGSEIMDGSPEDFGRFIAAETTKWSGVVRSAGVRLD